jgi:hypothetical protein
LNELIIHGSFEELIKQHKLSKKSYKNPLHKQRNNQNKGRIKNLKNSQIFPKFFLEKYLIIPIRDYWFIIIINKTMASNLERMNDILDFWAKDKTFQRSIDERSEKMNYRFFD